MRRLLGFMTCATILAIPLAIPISAHHHLRHDFYVSDQYTKEPVVGAVVTVFYADGQSQEGETRRPHGNIRFTLPGEFPSVDIRVEAEGYCTLDTTIPLGFRPHVGGMGIWIGLEPCSTEPR